jgi:hypothetical protein
LEEITWQKHKDDQTSDTSETRQATTANTHEEAHASRECIGLTNAATQAATDFEP